MLEIKDKVENYIDKIYAQIDATSTAEQNTEELKKYYYKIRLKLEGELQAMLYVEKLLKNISTKKRYILKKNKQQENKKLIAGQMLNRLRG